MVIKGFDSETVKELREPLDEDLKKVAEKYGLVATPIRGMNYTGSRLTFTLTFNVDGGDGMAEYQKEKEIYMLRAMGTPYNLKKEMIGKMFELRGKTWKLVGMVPRARRSEFLIVDEGSGDRLRVGASTIRKGIK
jgi:hypothetical protein